MSPGNKAPVKVLYISYWGAMEPLGQSLVVPAVKKLAAACVQLTLISFEKPDDLADQIKFATTAAALREQGIHWIPLRYFKNPKIVIDLVQGVFRSLLTGVRLRPDVVHGRSLIGGLMAGAVAPLLRAKFIFHNEGFFPDEQVDGGVWQKDSRLHRTFKFLEQQLYARADGIIALSHRAKAVLESLPRVIENATPIIVVPSCVDLEKFAPLPLTGSADGDRLRLIYIGSVGRRYRLDQISRFVTYVKEEFGQVHLQVLSQTEKEQVVAMLKEGGLAEADWSLGRVPHDEIPQHLAHHQAGLFFLTQGLSEHGCSPTKIGEYWACGLPVITTPNVSDTDEIIRRERVGVVVKAHTEAAYRQAAKELRELLQDPDLAARCRQAAERHYALAPACERQLNLYETMQSRAHAVRLSPLSDSIEQSVRTTEQ